MQSQAFKGARVLMCSAVGRGGLQTATTGLVARGSRGTFSVHTEASEEMWVVIGTRKIHYDIVLVISPSGAGYSSPECAPSASLG